MLDARLVQSSSTRRSKAIVTRAQITWTLTTIFLLMVTKGPVFWIRLEAAPLTGDFIDDVWVQLAFVTISASVIAVAWQARASLLMDRRLLAPFGAFLTIIVGSTVWSVDRSRTLEQGLMLLLGTIAALLAGSELGLLRLLGATWAAMQVGVLVSLWAVLRGWHLAYDIDHAMAGVYFNRNSLGPVAVLGAATSVALACYPWGTTRRWRLVVLGVAGTVDLVVSQRAGSLTPAFGAVVALLGTCFVLLLRPSVSRTVRRWLGGLLVVAILLPAAVISPGRLHRSSTLSHRTDIWDVVFGFVADRPVQGYGFMAMWNRYEMFEALWYRQSVVYEAHSGYFEVLLGAGALGLIALLATFGMVFRRTFSAMWRQASLVHVWAVWIVIYVAAVNLGETYVGANLLPWILLSAVAGGVAVTYNNPLRRPSTDQGVAVTERASRSLR